MYARVFAELHHTLFAYLDRDALAVLAQTCRRAHALCDAELYSRYSPVAMLRRYVGDVHAFAATLRGAEACVTGIALTACLVDIHTRPRGLEICCGTPHAADIVCPVVRHLLTDGYFPDARGTYMRACGARVAVRHLEGASSGYDMVALASPSTHTMHAWPVAGVGDLMSMYSWYPITTIARAAILRRPALDDDTEEWENAAIRQGFDIYMLRAPAGAGVDYTSSGIVRSVKRLPKTSVMMRVLRGVWLGTDTRRVIAHPLPRMDTCLREMGLPPRLRARTGKLMLCVERNAINSTGM